MTLYQRIASEYEKLFPSSNEKVEFIEQLIRSRSETRILDLGCATGELSFRLEGKSRTFTVLDPDETMIRQARSHTPEGRLDRFSFIINDMLSYISAASTDTFDLILCMGNTLAYLDRQENLYRFLLHSHRVLPDGGIIVLQVLNYTNPMFREGFRFPVLETDLIRFHRSYTSHEDPWKLRFTTEVTDRQSEETSVDVHTHSLFTGPLIERAARQTGFRNVELYGGYDRHPLQETDFFCLAVIER